MLHGITSNRTEVQLFFYPPTIDLQPIQNQFPLSRVGVIIYYKAILPIDTVQEKRLKLVTISDKSIKSLKSKQIGFFRFPGYICFAIDRI